MEPSEKPFDAFGCAAVRAGNSASAARRSGAQANCSMRWWDNAPLTGSTPMARWQKFTDP